MSTSTEERFTTRCQNSSAAEALNAVCTVDPVLRDHPKEEYNAVYKTGVSLIQNEMNTFDIDSFICVIRRDFSAYIDEALILELENRWNTNKLDKASFLAESIRRTIPKRMMTDTVLSGIEAIQDRSRRNARPPKQSIVEEDHHRTRRPQSSMEKQQTKLTDTDLATFQYYLHVMARGIKDKNRRDIKSVQSGCDETSPLSQDLYSIASSTDKWFKQMKTRDMTMVACIRWYESTLKGLLDSNDEHPDTIPYISADAMLDKNERAIFDSTYRLLEELQGQLREFQVKAKELQFYWTRHYSTNKEDGNFKRPSDKNADFQTKIEALEKTNSKLKNRLSTLRKQTEEKVAQLNKDDKKPEDKEKATDKPCELVEKGQTRIQQQETENSERKEREKGQVGESDTTQVGDKIIQMEKEINDLKVRLLFYEGGPSNRTIKEEAVLLKDNHEKLANVLPRKTEANKSLPRRDKELEKENILLKTRLQEAENKIKQLEQDGLSPKSLETETRHLRERNDTEHRKAKRSVHRTRLEEDNKQVEDRAADETSKGVNDYERQLNRGEEKKQHVVERATPSPTKSAYVDPSNETMTQPETEGIGLQTGQEEKGQAIQTGSSQSHQDSKQRSLKGSMKPFMLESASVNQWKETTALRQTDGMRMTPSTTESACVDPSNEAMVQPQTEGVGLQNRQEEKGQVIPTGSAMSHQEGKQRNLKGSMKPVMLESASVNQWKEATALRQTDGMRSLDADSPLGYLEQGDIRLESLDMDDRNLQDSYQRSPYRQRDDVRSVRVEIERDKEDLQNYRNKPDQQQRDVSSVKPDMKEDKDDSQSRPQKNEDDVKHSEQSDIGITGQEGQKKLMKDRMKPYLLESASVNQWKETAKVRQTEENRPQKNEDDVKHSEQSDIGITGQEGQKKLMKDRMKPYLLESASVNQWKETAKVRQTEENSNIGRIKGHNIEAEMKQLQTENSSLTQRNSQLQSQLEQQQREYQRLRSDLQEKSADIKDSYQRKLDQQHRDVRNIRSDLEDDKDDIQKSYQNKLDQRQREVRNIRSDLEDDKDDIRRRLEQIESEKSDREDTIHQLEKDKQDLEEKLQLTIDEHERNIATVHLEKEKTNSHTRTKPEDAELATVRQWKETAKRSKEEKAKAGNSFLDTNEKTMQELEEEIKQLKDENNSLNIRLQEMTGEVQDTDQTDSGITRPDGDKSSLKDRVKPYMLESASVNQWKETMTQRHTEENRLQEAEGRAGYPEQADIPSGSLETDNKNLQDRNAQLQKQLDQQQHEFQRKIEDLQNSYQNKLDHSQRDIRNVRSDLEDDKDDIQKSYQNKLDQRQREVRNVRSDLQEDKEDLHRRLRQIESEKGDSENTSAQLEKEKQDLEEKLQLATDENERHVETSQQLEQDKPSVQTGTKPENVESSAVQHWIETARKSQKEKSKPGNSFLDTDENQDQKLDEADQQLKGEQGETESLNIRNAELQKQLEHQQIEMEKLKSDLRQFQDKNVDSQNSNLDQQQRAVRDIRSDLEDDNDDLQRSYQNKLDQRQRDIRNIRSDLEDDKDDIQRRMRQTETEKSDREKTITRLEREKQDLEEKLQLSMDENKRHIEKVQHLEKETAIVQTRSSPETIESASGRPSIETSRKLQKETSKPGNSFLDMNENTVNKEEENQQLNNENGNTIGNRSSTTSRDSEIHPHSEATVNSERKIINAEDKLKDMHVEKQQGRTVELQSSNYKLDKGVRHDVTGGDPKKLEELEVHVMYLESEKKSADKRNEQLQRQMQQQQRDLQRIESELRQSQTRNDDLQNRLGKVAATPLTHTNQNSADTGDEGKPKRLTEQLSQLYDNEWTDSFSAIEDDPTNTGTEEDIVKQLRDILMNCFGQCTHISKKQIAGIKTLLLSPITGASTKENQLINVVQSLKKSLSRQLTTEQAETITRLRKQTTSYAVEDIKQEMIKTYQASTNYREMKLFIEKCTELCWLMAIQSPPVVIDDRPRPGDRFDRDVFKAYTKAGKIIEFVVLPPVYLHKGGPLLCKGTAQGKR